MRQIKNESDVQTAAKEGEAVVGDCHQLSDYVLGLDSLKNIRNSITMSTCVLIVMDCIVWFHSATSLTVCS